MDTSASSSSSSPFFGRWSVRIGSIGFLLLIAVGVFAANDWFPRTDALSGKKFGWFGREMPKHSTASNWNPLPVPSPTPQLSKEYIYAGQRLLAVEDANAQAAPPADIAVWRPANGYWFVMGQTGSQSVSFGWGIGGYDIPVVGDYDGDGKTDFTAFRPDSTAVFYVWASDGSGWWGYSWGVSTDRPVVGDFDGDGRTDYAVVRRDAGAGISNFYIVPSGGGSWYGYSYGTDTDEVAVADYDGDGKSDIGVFRPGMQTFFWYGSADGNHHYAAVGVNGTVVSSDYDGDGLADPAVFNPANAQWTIHHSTTGGVSTVMWGSAGASGCTGGNCTGIRPVQNDYDGDGRTDLAVFDNAATATWKIKRSSDGSTRTETWGTTGDIPVPAYYRR